MIILLYYRYSDLYGTNGTGGTNFARHLISSNKAVYITSITVSLKAKHKSGHLTSHNQSQIELKVRQWPILVRIWYIVRRLTYIIDMKQIR